MNSGYTLKGNQAFDSVIWYIEEEKIRIFKCGLVNVLSGEGNGTPLQYSCLENPMDGGAW